MTITIAAFAIVVEIIGYITYFWLPVKAARFTLFAFGLVVIALGPQILGRAWYSVGYLVGLSVGWAIGYSYTREGCAPAAN